MGKGIAFQSRTSAALSKMKGSKGKSHRRALFVSLEAQIVHSSSVKPCLTSALALSAQHNLLSGVGRYRNGSLLFIFSSSLLAWKAAHCLEALVDTSASSSRLVKMNDCRLSEPCPGPLPIDTRLPFFFSFLFLNLLHLAHSL